jgi:vitamin B12 transporter
VPNLIDLYYAPFGYSNPDLKPEISDNFDIGIDQKIGDRALLRLTYFNNTIDDAIVNGSTQPINVQKVRAQGLEAALNVQITPNIYAFANYTLNDSKILKDQTSLNEGNELRYAGTNFGTIGIAYQQPKGLYLGLFLKQVGDRFPTEANIDPLPSYTNVDLRAHYPINEKVNLTASWENIFDDHYEVSPGYPGVGSRFQIGINAKFR